ncbi:MAG: hypothetical protein DCC75_06090 [Proteobacteria bacterium]|nr:MAG: hypothetical protein DCC75_06090 [Pseudomonadota bacterium]
MKPSVSIVINTLNRAFCLETTLQALFHLDYPNFEVIVVNGPSSDGTEAILERYKNVFKIERCPEPNLSMSRNFGIAAASGEIVAFIDDDGIPEPEWLDRLVAPYSDPAVGGVGGFVFDRSGVQFQTRYLLSNRLGYSEQVAEVPAEALDRLNLPGSFVFPGLIGVNSSFRRQALLEIGGFDEHFNYYLDETDVCVRLIDKGWKLKVVPNAYVHHKAAPGGMRHLRFYARSQAYFIMRNAVEKGVACDVRQAIQPGLDLHRNSVAQALKQGIVNDEQAAALLRELEEGMEAGIHAAKQTPVRKLLPANVKPAPFKPVVSVKQSGKKMVICLLSQDYPPTHNGGIGRWTREMALGLSQKGHDVHVITRSATDQHTVDFEEGAWVHRIVPLIYNQSPIPDNFKLPPFVRAYSTSIYYEVKRIETHHKVDLVTSPIWDVEGLACLFDRSWRTVLTLQTTYALSADNHHEWRENGAFWKEHVEPMIAAERYFLEKADAIQSISHAILNLTEASYGVSQIGAKAKVFPIGLGDLSASTARKPAQGSGAVTVLFVGRFEHRKGIDTLMETIPALCREFPEVRFMLAGDDSLQGHRGTPYKKEFLGRFEGEEFLRRVEFLGRVDDERLFQLYSECDLFVAPSRFESFGIIFLEAMMFGKPVIGCRAGGMPEIIEDGVSGRLVEPEDSKALHHALRELISDAELRRRMGAAARDCYQRRFSREAMIAELEKMYREQVELRRV